MYNHTKCFRPSIVTTKQATELTPIVKPTTQYHQNDKLPIVKRARTAVNGKYFQMAAILTTGFAVFSSTLVKLLIAANDHEPLDHAQTLFPRPPSMSPHSYTSTLFFIAVYLMIQFWFCGEICLRIMLNGKHFFVRAGKGLRLRNFFEILIVFGDTIISIVVVSKLALYLAHPTFTFFGCLMPVRFAVYIMTAPPLHALIRGIKRALKTIVFISIFCAILIYISSVLSHVLFGPMFNDDCEVCENRFGSVQAAFFSILQVISCDTWVDDLVVPLTEQSIYSVGFVWSFFGMHVFLSLFIFLNIFAAVMCEGIIRSPQESNTSSIPNDEYSTNYSNYGLLRELFCGICLLSEYVSKKQTHPDEEVGDIETGHAEYPHDTRHSEMMEQFATMTLLVKRMSQQMEQMRIEMRENKHVSEPIPIPRENFTFNSI